MAIQRWEPLSLSDFFDEEILSPQRTQKLPLDLAVDLFEEKDNLVANLNVAGIEPDDLDVTVEDGYLRVAGSRNETNEVKDKNYYSKQISRGSFERVIPLPIEIDKDSIKAEIDNGILVVTMPKKQEVADKKKKVEVTKKK